MSSPEFAIKAVGWKVIVEPVEVPKKVGRIDLADETIKSLEFLRYVGKVVDVGPDAYKGEAFLGGEPWCKCGDMVAFGRHAGQEVIIRANGGSKRLRVLNDDDILVGVVSPDEIVTPL